MLDSWDSDVIEFYVDVFVKNPKIEDDLYVSYEIIIQTNNISFTASRSAIRRRYSEFVVLYKLLAKGYPCGKLPSLPPKYPFKDHFDPMFIENRRHQLEEFLKKLLSQKIYFSSKSLHLFLQSSLSMTYIKNVTQGNSIPVESIMSPRLSNGVASNRIPKAVRISSASNIADLDTNSSSSYSSTDSKISTKSDSTGTTEVKRVSFCNEVTVAQILLD